MSDELSVDFVCCKCHRFIDMGLNGIFVDDVPMCDECAGVERDNEGYAWMAYEETMTLCDPDTLEEEVITREQAFGKFEES